MWITFHPVSSLGERWKVSLCHSVTPSLRSEIPSRVPFRCGVKLLVTVTIGDTQRDTQAKFECTRLGTAWKQRSTRYLCPRWETRLKGYCNRARNKGAFVETATPGHAALQSSTETRSCCAAVSGMPLPSTYTLASPRTCLDERVNDYSLQRHTSR